MVQKFLTGLRPIIRYGLDTEEDDSDSDYEYEYTYTYTYKEDMDNGRRPDAEFGNTLKDEIRKRGAMDTLTNDRAQAEISKRVKTIYLSLRIGNQSRINSIRTTPSVFTKMSRRTQIGF